MFSFMDLNWKFSLLSLSKFPRQEKLVDEGGRDELGVRAL